MTQIFSFLVEQERSNGLLKTNLTGVALESCNASLLGYNANDRSLRNGVNLGQICAYDPDARQDSCEGDSGKKLIQLLVGIFCLLMPWQTN